MFHQAASVETIKMKNVLIKTKNFKVTTEFVQTIKKFADTYLR